MGIARWVGKRLVMVLAPRAAVVMTAAGAGADYQSSVKFIDYPNDQPVYSIERIEMMDLQGTLPTHTSKAYPRRDPARVEAIVWHHSASNGQSIRTLAQFHVQTRDWPGIGYHYAVGWDGTIYVMHGHDVVSYHCAGFNARTIGIVLVGNFHERDVPEAMQHGIARLRRHLQGQGIAVEYLHKDKVATACPGRFAERILRP
jgi:hypothetical protein